MGRFPDLWAYNADGTDLVTRGSYVDYGPDEPVEVDGFFDESGRPIEVTHWTPVLEGETEPPQPPVLVEYGEGWNHWQVLPAVEPAQGWVMGPWGKGPDPAVFYQGQWWEKVGALKPLEVFYWKDRAEGEEPPEFERGFQESCVPPGTPHRFVETVLKSPDGEESIVELMCAKCGWPQGF